MTSWEVTPFTPPAFKRVNVGVGPPKHCLVVTNVNRRRSLPGFEFQLQNDHLCDCVHIISTFRASAAPSIKMEKIVNTQLIGLVVKMKGNTACKCSVIDYYYSLLLSTTLHYTFKSTCTVFAVRTLNDRVSFMFQHSCQCVSLFPQ